MIKSGLTPRFAEIGKIKVGGKGKQITSKNGKDFQPPVKFDHFVITTIEKGADNNFLPDTEMMKKLGGKPKEIPIRLLFDDIDINFFTSFQFYAGAKLKCKGDGEHATKYYDDTRVDVVECNPEKCEFARDNRCKISGILSCMIQGQSQFGGVYRFRTHGWNSVSNILASLQFISANNNGILAGLPLRLKMIKTPTQEHGMINTVTLVIDCNDVAEMRQLALREFESRRLIGLDIKQIEESAVRAGITIDTDSESDVQQEFYPEPPEKGVSGDDLNNILSKKESKLS